MKRLTKRSPGDGQPDTGTPAGEKPPVDGPSGDDPSGDDPADGKQVGEKPSGDRLDQLHRLRDLRGGARLAAVVIALGLVLVPLIAAGVNAGRWVPQGDNALIELRARDVGTERNPLVGQPSTSATYGSGDYFVAHPGPLGFVVLVPGIAVLGSSAGILVSAALVSAASMLAVAWLVFRHLGPRGGSAAAALVSLAAFSAGAAGLVDPLSSNFGRMTLLAAAVCVWALWCGDLRIAPLTVIFVTFTAQQHLAVLPAAALVAMVGVAAIGWELWRRDRAGRRAALRWLLVAAGVGLVLWMPVLWQQVTGEPGNLTAMAGYSGDAERVDLGVRSAIDQVSVALGPRPFLGRSSPTGWDLLVDRSGLVNAAVLVLVGIGLAAAAWWQRRDRRFLAMVAMVGMLAAVGVVNGANIPDSIEQGRINFYHWAFALSFFELLLVAWIGALLAPVLLPQVRHGRALTAAVASGAVIAVVAVTPLVVERPSDRLPQPIESETIRELQDQLAASDAVNAAAGPLLVEVNGSDQFIQLTDTLGTELAADGVPVVFPMIAKGAVHPTLVAEPCAVEGALVITLVNEQSVVPPGELVAEAAAAPDLDEAALDRLLAQTEGVSVDLGPDLQAALDRLPGDQGALRGTSIAFRLGSDPNAVFMSKINLDMLIADPPASPALDHDDLVALRESMPAAGESVVARSITVHLLDAAQMAEWQPDYQEGC